MKMNVIIVHGCLSPASEEKASNPQTRTYDKHWLSWLKDELSKKKIECFVPLMPTPWNPNYLLWKKEFDKLNVNEKDILIGHSCGCAFLVRWLGDTKNKIKKLILVAPWKIPSKDFSEGENNLYDYEIFSGLKNNIKKVTIFTSDDDDKDGIKSARIYHKILGGRLMELKEHGHFVTGDMGTNKFPELLKEVLK